LGGDSANILIECLVISDVGVLEGLEVDVDNALFLDFLFINQPISVEFKQRTLPRTSHSCNHADQFRTMKRYELFKIAISRKYLHNSSIKEICQLKTIVSFIKETIVIIR
jgi:hypothetical protein